ncbi:DUF6615 family protein [Streptomyces sp. MS1.AVA.3]|uniref:DUF6615 family protein n=1 Tax=Streptomyces decoyicus TaxID=249567 RepID=UPI0030C25058
MAEGYANGWAPGEESFTDFNLQDIRREHGGRVTIRQFNRAQEAENGADWEWWFHDGVRGVGMRVQAKKAQKNGSFRLRYRSGRRRQGPLQSLQLIEDAVTVDCLPFYVLYNHRNWVPIDDELAVRDCQHSNGDQRQLGCTLVSALVVQRVIDDPLLPASHARDVSVPWNWLVCDDGVRPTVPTLDALWNQARFMHQEGIHFHDFLVESVPRADDRGVASERSESVRFERDQSPLYREVARIAERPVRPLSERGKGMITGEMTESPDERLAGAVLIDVREDEGRTQLGDG